MKYECPNKNEECHRYFNFQDSGIFVWSRDICIGDEVFHRLLIPRGKRESFLATFCYEMTQEYKFLFAKTAPFVSCAVFIDCFFSWVINWGIDYRGLDAIDPWCQHNPKSLACDGVHVGVALKFLSKFKPITDSDKEQTKTNAHRRFDRTLLNGRTERQKRLRRYFKSYVNNLTSKKIPTKKSRSNNTKEKPSKMEQATFQRCALSETEIINLHDDYRYKKVLHGIFDGVYQKELLKKMVSLVWALSKSAALLAFFPWEKLDTFRTLFTQFKHSDTSSLEELKSNLQDLRVQFADIMTSAIRHYKTDEVADFFLYLLDEVERIHGDDTNQMPDNPGAVSSYDPSMGTAYYFTPHGNQIRRTPNYQMDGNA